MRLSTLLPAAALAVCALTAETADAQTTTRNCFILVHGYKSDTDLSDKSAALNYWRANGDFGRAVTGGDRGVDHYAIVGWNSRDKPYWHPDAAGSVAGQIAHITDAANTEASRGAGETHDGVDHERQCNASDRFYVVAHSQGAQVLMYINGNAQQGDPNLNKVSARDDDVLWHEGDALWPEDRREEEFRKLHADKVLPDSQPSATGFDTAMSRVVALITVGGAVNGTEGMDLVCNNAVSAALASAVGRTCVPSLQTLERMNVSSWTGPAMWKPTYAIGGHGTTLLSGTLTGEDDGVVNFASQMNCEGSPKRNLWEDLRERSGWRVTFTCDNAHKRHANHYNLASIDIAHNAEVTAPGGYWDHSMSGASVLSCGDWWDVPGTIAQCISQIR